ncbi:MAG: gamma-glutamylcyclotransferase family protein [Sphingomicrobium sp.]
MADPVWIFSYGTLRQPEVQQQLFGRTLEHQADALAGFRLGMVSISNPEVVRLSGSTQHPGLIASGDASDRIEGAALAVSAEELAVADLYESADYERVSVTLASGRPGFVYLARQQQ